MTVSCSGGLLDPVYNTRLQPTVAVRPGRNMRQRNGAKHGGIQATLACYSYHHPDQRTLAEQQTGLFLFTPDISKDCAFVFVEKWLNES